MENFVTDDFWNNFKYKNGCWFRRTDAPLLSSNGNLILVVQDANKEGILGV